jgi:hypothetical protein
MGSSLTICAAVAAARRGDAQIDPDLCALNRPSRLACSASVQEPASPM